MGSYVPSTTAERQEMLAAAGFSKMEDLFAHIPQEVLLKEPLNIPAGKSELEVSRMMGEMAGKNKVFPSIFRGAGAYDHYIPAIVKSVTSKEEFVTSYTPYQAEISQGVLQSIFEYQTMICEITGMDASNASVYDGATAAAEAISMCRERSRTVAYVSAACNPSVLRVLKTYCFSFGTELVIVPEKDGRTDFSAIEGKLDGKTTACLYVEQPNYYGLLEDVEKAAQVIHDAGGKLIVGCNPISLGILKTPAECGADIAVGEGQPLGMPLAFGGPYLGFMATKSAMTRKLPGRIVGETVDVDGKRAFVLTLQAREQHIRREKASSNICSNQALCAMTAAVYLAAMGADGLAQAATLSMSKAHYLAQELGKIPGFERKHTGEFFHEFVTGCPICPHKLMAELEKRDILGGLPLSGAYEGCILWCCTEKNTKEDIDRLVAIVKEVAAQ